MRSLHVVTVSALTLAATGIVAQPLAPHEVVDQLLATDRAFSKASSEADLVNGLASMFAPDVVMPMPEGRFARGIDEAKQALRSNADNAGARAEWIPIRGGISADGQHGFTFGYMSVTRTDGTRVPAKYLSYWIKAPQGWRVAAYKRSRAEKPPGSIAAMAPALPARLVPITSDELTVDAHRRSLDAAERAFSDDAQTIGIGPAFVKYGRADAINLGPPAQPEVTVGSEAIGQFVGAAYPRGAPGITWAPDAVIVASSGDLGVTIGFIRTNRPSSDGRPAAIPFFTIWRRDAPDDSWRYIAE